MTPQPTQQRIPWSYWLLGAALVAYVALCTGNRDNHWETDAWEHHRVVAELAREPWNPRNPTYDLDVPSVRYSPYMLALAGLSRTTGLDPYHALSAAAVANTVLLLIALALLLKQFDEPRIATAALLVMVALYGGPPGYANSYALADLPWHQVNPSAFAYAATLFAWAAFRNLVNRDLQRPWLPLAAIVVLSTLAMLDHGMTGAFNLLALAVFALTAPRHLRLKLLALAVLVGVAVALVALAWPYYDFLEAVRNRRDRAYWFNPSILKLMLFQWCAPAVLAGVLALVVRDRPIVRTFLAGALASFAVGLAAWALQSAALARFPLPGMIFLHVPVAVLVHESGLLRPSTWPERLRSILRPDRSPNARPIIETALALLIVYFLVPQLISILREPHLARPYLARALGKEDKQNPLRQRLQAVLEPVGEHDVVLADRVTAWPVPAIAGRIVSALHYELFVDDQARRQADVEAFFSPATPTAQRREILDRYHVRWILINLQTLDPTTRAALVPDAAPVAGESADFILLDAHRLPPAPPHPAAALP